MGCGASVPKSTPSGVVIKEAGAFKLPDGETAGKDSLLFCPPPKTKTGGGGGKYRGRSRFTYCQWCFTRETKKFQLSAGLYIFVAA